jgi:hypothetical protein
MPRLSLLDIVIIGAVLALLIAAARQDFPRFGTGAAPEPPTALQPAPPAAREQP